MNQRPLGYDPSRLGAIPNAPRTTRRELSLLSLGLLERDGVFIILGYAMNVATIVYFSVLALSALLAGQSLLHLFGR